MQLATHHGPGNDFVIVDPRGAARAWPGSITTRDPAVDSGARAKSFSDREAEFEAGSSSVCDREVEFEAGSSSVCDREAEFEAGSSSTRDRAVEVEPRDELLL